MYKKTALLILSITCYCHFLIAQEKSTMAEEIIKRIENTPDSLLNDVADQKIRQPMDSVKFAKMITAGTPEGKKVRKKVSLAIKVVDAKTNEPIEAIINLKAISETKTAFEGVGMCNEKGIFQLKLGANSDIELTVSFPEYLPIHKTFDFISGDEKGKKKVHKKYKLTKLVVGEYIQLKRIYFQEGEHKLLAQSYEQLNTLVTLMNNHPKMKIEIAGHTDNSGSSKYNHQLSQKRAEAVKKYLVKKDIKKSRIKPKGYGGEKPLVSGTDAKSKQQNRRVEIKVLKL